MKMYEWLMGAEYDALHIVEYFLLYLNCENYMKLLICGGVVDIYVNVDNGHDYVFVLIVVMLVNNHDDACWITMMKMLVNYIRIYAYMLLVNLLACYWWWFDGVSIFWNMSMTLIELWLVDGVDVTTWWCNWWWINQCKWRCTFTLMLVNTYVRWFCVVESLVVCSCIIVMLSLHMMFLLHHRTSALQRSFRLRPCRDHLVI